MSARKVREKTRPVKLTRPVSDRVTVGSTWSDAEVATLAKVLRALVASGLKQTPEIASLQRKSLRLEALVAAKRGALLTPPARVADRDCLCRVVNGRLRYECSACAGKAAAE